MSLSRQAERQWLLWDTDSYSCATSCSDSLENPNNSLRGLLRPNKTSSCLTEVYACYKYLMNYSAIYRVPGGNYRFPFAHLAFMVRLEGVNLTPEEGRAATNTHQFN